MALQVTYSKPPKDSVVLTRQEALIYQWKQIKDQPFKEVWPFSGGIIGLGILAAGTAMSINQRFRSTLKLRHYGYVSSGFPLIIAPVIFAGVFHSKFISEDIFIGKTACPLCLQFQAVAVQLTFGVGWPMILAPLANFTFALRYGTYSIPDWKDLKGTYNLWLKIMRRVGKRTLIFACIQSVAAGYITYAEARSLYKLRYKFQAMSEESEAVELNKVSE